MRPRAARLIPRDGAQRWLAAGNLVNMTGTGATLSCLVLFLAQAKQLPLASTTAVLTTTGVVGVLGAVPLGHVSDRFGARAAALGTELACAAATVGLVLAGNMWLCALCLAARQLATSGNGAARSTLMGRLVPADERTALRAFQRTVTNIGFSVGALIAAAAVAGGSPELLSGVLVFDAATFCFSAYATARLPEVERGTAGPGLAFRAVRDAGYLSAAVLNAVHAVNRAIVSVGVPLWIVYGSQLPGWAVSAAMVLNTVVVVALQVPLGHLAKHLAGARRALLLAGGLTAAGCASLGAGQQLAPGWAWPLLALACLTLAVGEVLGAAAGWTLSYDLAPEGLLGQYQGVWQLVADGSAKAIGPAVTGWAVAAGTGGWLGLAAGFGWVAAVSPWTVQLASANARGAPPPSPAALPPPRRS